MSILSRAGDILSSNINAMLDKMEDPSKMVDQYLRKAKEDFAEVKQETAKVMADEKRCKKLYDEAQAAVDKAQKAAESAVNAGKDEDALAILAKQGELEANRAAALNTYNAAKANSAKMRQLHNKLAKDISDLEARRNNVKAMNAVAKSQESVNKFSNGSRSGARAMEGFSRMEAKAMERMNTAEAMADLNADEFAGDDASKLIDSYASGTASASAADKLAALKAKLGKD